MSSAATPVAGAATSTPLRPATQAQRSSSPALPRWRPAAAARGRGRVRVPC